MDEANAKRISQTKENNTILADKIKEIKAEFQGTHNGKEPPLSKIAEILNERHIESPRGNSKWYAMTVKRIITPTIETSTKYTTQTSK